MACVSKVLRNAWGPNPPHFGHDLLANFERPFRVTGTGDALKELAAGGIPGVSLAELARVRVPRRLSCGAQTEHC